MWPYFIKLYRGTTSEHALEPAVAALGVPYRWQMPLGRFFADFAWPVERIVVEVDGDSHRTEKQVTKDREREADMLKRGWVTVRCWNEDAVADPHGTTRRLREEGLALAQARDLAALESVDNPPTVQTRPRKRPKR